ncbi:cell division protein FtsX [Marinithermus hydrothermalis]|uniref:Cell division protein FtsX n=1 Tax=Marinithermus hydrothermalis (strain DSM 14884 / JCM 11576 / T1) TaxID=869210 RepID=F2NQS3_MARHT|nr:ABC transporter permease [Marinithermus hydrothermalis]AEB12287.1 protein of unknown function DUF214 [Marinithermus hydrothermalis DSM 14884]
MYALAQALRAFKRHPTSALATFTTATVSFALLFLVGLVLWNLDRVIATIQSEVEVVAFLQDGTAPEALLAEVRRWPEVREARFVSKEEALATLQLDYPYLAQASSLIENPLPHTLHLQLTDPAQVRQVAERLARMPGVADVEYGGEITERLIRLLHGLRVGANVLMLLLVLDTFFSVMGTIRLSIENRREELRIMLLVGATRQFVQAPFLLEGLLLTLSAALIALALGNLAYRAVSEAVQELLPFVPVLSREDLLAASASLLLLSTFIGYFGAWLSSRSHMQDSEI